MAKKIKKTIPWFLIIGMVCLLGVGFYFETPKVSAGTTSGTSATVNNINPGASATINGGSNITPVSNNTVLVNITGSVVDSNGCATISSVTAVAYISNLAITCSAEDNSCYTGISCTTSGCSGGSDVDAVVTCATNIWFHANPATWTGAIRVTDSGTGVGSGTSSNVTLTTLLSLDVAASIGYGALDPGGTTGATNQSVVISDVGNAAMDCSVKGTDMTAATPGTILASKQKYDLAAFTYASAGTAFTAKDTDAALELVCVKPTAHPTGSTDLIYWGLGVDAGTPSGSYSGTNTFTVTVE